MMGQHNGDTGDITGCNGITFPSQLTPNVVFDFMDIANLDQQQPRFFLDKV